MKKYFLSLRTFVFAGLILIAGIGAAHATLSKVLNIEQLSFLAKTIVKASVVDIAIEHDSYESGKMVQYVTLDVKEWLKGDAVGGDKLIFKQLAEGSYEADGIKIRQNLFFPKYEVGKTYLFFLPNAHSKTGLLAPIGLDQGLYVIETDDDGNEVMPQLKVRSTFLQKGLKENSKGRFLKAGVTNLKSDNSYDSFKNLVKDSLK